MQRAPTTSRITHVHVLWDMQALPVRPMLTSVHPTLVSTAVARTALLPIDAYVQQGGVDLIVMSMLTSVARHRVSTVALATTTLTPTLVLAQQVGPTVVRIKTALSISTNVDRLRVSIDRKSVV